MGIGGEELHFHGRLCAVADVYDALSSYRPYRKPMPTGQIREHFRAYAGERYDPAIVEAWEATLATRGAAHAETSVAP